MSGWWYWIFGFCVLTQGYIHSFSNDKVNDNRVCVVQKVGSGLTRQREEMEFID